MPASIDRDLDALAHIEFQPGLDGLEDRVWAQVQARKVRSVPIPRGLNTALALAALVGGLVFGALHSAPPLHLTEMGVLSEDGALAPSIRLGG